MLIRIKVPRKYDTFGVFLIVRIVCSLEIKGDKMRSMVTSRLQVGDKWATLEGSWQNVYCSY